MKKPTLQKRMVLNSIHSLLVKKRNQPNLGYVPIDDLVTGCITWDASHKPTQSRSQPVCKDLTTDAGFLWRGIPGKDCTDELNKITACLLKCTQTSPLFLSCPAHSHARTRTHAHVHTHTTVYELLHGSKPVEETVVRRVSND